MYAIYTHTGKLQTVSLVDDADNKFNRQIIIEILKFNKHNLFNSLIAASVHEEINVAYT